MSSKDDSIKPNLLMISEDLDNIQEFDENNYQNRRYNSNNINQGKKFFKLRYIKNKLKIELNNKTTNLKIEKELLPSFNSNELEKLKSYEALSLTFKKTVQKNIQKYSIIFLILLEKSIFYFNTEKIKESYDILFDFDIIKNEAEFGEILLTISGYDKNIIKEKIFKNEEKKEIIKGFLNVIQMSQFKDLFECFKFINSKVEIPTKGTNNMDLILNTIVDRFFEDNKNNKKIMNIYKSRTNIFIFLKALLTYNMLKEQNIKMSFDDFNGFLSFLNANDIKNLYQKLNTDFNLDIDYVSDLYEKLNVFLEETEINFDKNELIEEIINENKNNKSISLIKKNFNCFTNISFEKKEQETLTFPIELNRISGSNLSLKEYIVCDNFSKIIFEKNFKDKVDLKNMNSINMDDIIDIRLGSSGENFKKYFKSYPNEEKNQNNFISLICPKDQIDFKSTNVKNGLKWFKAMKSLILFRNKSKEKKEDEKIKIKNDINIIWKNYILPKWNIYGNYFLFKTLDRANYLNDINFNPEGKKQNITIKYDIFEDKKTSLIKTINYFLKEVKDKLGKKEDKILEFNEFMVLCQLGISDTSRKNIWPILIGNKLGIINLKDNITKINNFDILEQKYLKNPNIYFSKFPLINTMIKDIIKIKYYFLSEIKSKKFPEKNLMSKVYTICRSFFLNRFDISYNRNIIFLIYVFLLKQMTEEQTFISINNLICSNSTLANIYLWKKKYIKINEFFNEKLEEISPKLFNHFKKLDIPCQIYLFDWIESLFTKILDINISSMIIDFYLIFGEHVLIQAGITILKIMEEDLINMNVEEILNTLNNNLLKNIDVYQFLECYRNLGGIKNDYIEYKSKNEFGIQKTDLLEILIY